MIYIIKVLLVQTVRCPHLGQLGTAQDLGVFKPNFQNEASVQKFPLSHLFQSDGGQFDIGRLESLEGFQCA